MPVTIQDNEVSLWRKIASAWYDIAIDEGVTGLTPPSVNDNKTTLMKKVAYYTAQLAS
jgi:hypothetical protein